MTRSRENRRTKRSRLLRLLLPALALVAFPLGAAAEHSQHAVRPEYENPSHVAGLCSASGGLCYLDDDCPGEEICNDPSGNPVGPRSVFYSGMLVHDAAAACDCDPDCEPGCRPGNGTQFLQSAGFGQPLARDIPYEGFVEDALDRGGELLYYTESDDVLCICSGPPYGDCDSDDDCTSGVCEDPAGDYCGYKAAFRYKHLLYGMVAGGVVNMLETCSNPDSCMDEYYGDAERARSETAEIILRDAIKYAPTDRTLRGELLDIYYDRAVAELALAKENMVEAAKARIFPALDTPINDEISWFESSLEDPDPPGGLRYAVEGYFGLLTQGLGVTTSTIDPDAYGDPPFGYYIFEHDVPGRSLYQATYIPSGRADPIPVSQLVWEAETDYAQGTIIQPTTPNGDPGWTHVYIAVNTGTSDTAEPTWPVSDGGTVLDGDITWEEHGVVEVGAALPLFSGFKDLVMLFGLLRDYADTTVEVARLYVMRSGPDDDQNGVSDDIEQALDLVQETHQRLLLDGQTLLAVFRGCSVDGNPCTIDDDCPEIPDPPYPAIQQTCELGRRLPPTGHASGVAEAITGWEGGLTRLTEVRSFAEGNSNILGYSPDFLMLVHDEQPPVDCWDSYNCLSDFLDPGDGCDPYADPPNCDDSTPLGRAVNRRRHAELTYADYRGKIDQLKAEFSEVGSTLGVRLAAIVGKYQGQPGYDTPFDCGPPPDGNEGSEICLQMLSIDIAKNRIERNRVEKTNLVKQVEIEIERRAQEHNIKNAMGRVYITYGNKQASLTEKISFIQAAQVFADKMADAVDNFASGNLWGGGAAAANAALQAGFEIGKGQLEKQKELAAAAEQSEINALDDDLLDNESQANIKTWLLQLDELMVDSLEAGLVLNQEIARLTSLLNEQADLERRIAESNTALAGRYHADPTHRMRMQGAMVEAVKEFENAQKWTFFTARALEYKWNRPFVTQTPPIYSLGAVYRARQATELMDIYAAMKAYDVGPDRDDYFDVVSLRKDVFGFVDGQTYIDPVTGETLDAVEAFRQRLLQSVEGGHLNLDFSTVVNPAGSNFFRGAVWSWNEPTGPWVLVSPGMWNDKITTLDIVLVGPGYRGARVAADLIYAGTSFVRNDEAGQFDPVRPDHIEDEMTAYATRHWYKIGDDWRMKEGYRGSVNLLERSPTDPRPVDSDCNIDLGQGMTWDLFQERSVAATGWRLSVTDAQSLIDFDTVEDIEVWMCHLAYTRQ